MADCGVTESMTALYQNQIEFIRYLQRLMQEGDFSSTYKFAFLHALADICIETPCPNHASLKISLDDIVDKFLMLYWRHARPFGISDNDNTLRQNTGSQSKIITDIQNLQRDGFVNIARAKYSDQWQRIHKNTLRTLKEGPLWRLQILSKTADCYLYPHIKGRNYIELNPGIADCFREFHDLVTQFARQGWLEKVTKIQQNQSIIGAAGELSEFLFGKSRNSLQPALPVLKDIQKNRCFYCNKPLGNSAEVDHFIPYSKYHNDLGHNFVLAHRACNQNKRDYLAAPQHRDNWIEQNLVIHEHTIHNELSPYFSCDAKRSAHVTTWAYDIAVTNNNKFWMANKDIFV